MNCPRISIVTPSFNQGEFLEECIESVLCQGYPNLEYIIMDGGSTDGSVELIRKYEKYLAYWQSKPDGGQYAAINDGFSRTSGEIMAWLNSDDKYHADALYIASYVFAARPQVDWITGRPTFWDKAGELTHLSENLPVYSRPDFLDMKYNDPFIQQESTFWRRSLWDKAGGSLSAELDYAGDLELWMRFFRLTELYSVDALLGGYRTHGNQKAILSMDKYVTEAEAALRKELELVRSGLFPRMNPAPEPIVLSAAAIQTYCREVIADTSRTHVPCGSQPAIQRLLRYLVDKGAEIASLRDHVTSLEVHIEQTACRINEMESSRSWRLTRPLRWFGDKMAGRE